MSSATANASKNISGNIKEVNYDKWYIIIGVILLVLIIIYAVMIYFMHRNKTYFFKDYTPSPDTTTGLYQPNAELYTTPLTPEEEAKRLEMIKNAQNELNSRI